MGVGAGLSMYVVVVQKFTFAISSPDEFLFCAVIVWKNLRFCAFVNLPASRVRRGDLEGDQATPRVGHHDYDIDCGYGFMTMSYGYGYVHDGLWLVMIMSVTTVTAL